MQKVQIEINLSEEDCQALGQLLNEYSSGLTETSLPDSALDRLISLGLIFYTEQAGSQLTELAWTILHNSTGDGETATYSIVQQKTTPVLFLSEQQLGQVYEQRSFYVPFRRVAEGNFQLPLYRHPVDKVYLVRGFYDYTGSTVVKAFLDKIQADKFKDSLLAHLAVRPEFDAMCTDEEYEVWKTANDKWIENGPLQGMDCDHYDVYEMELT